MSTRVDDALRSTKRQVYLPAQPAIHVVLGKNRILQLWNEEALLEGAEVAFLTGASPSGTALVRDQNREILLVGRRSAGWDDHREVLLTPGGTMFASAAEYERHRSGTRWIQPLPEDTAEWSTSDWEARLSAVRKSWVGKFTFLEASGSTSEEGLRPPQIGALHALLGHRRMSSAPATVVMPTGTGKTEVMVALLVAQRLDRVLVVVPNDALREQTARKFRRLGLLSQLKVLGPGAQNPVVGTLHSAPQSVEDVAALFRRCNVVVATMQAVARATIATQAAIASEVSDLFIDEAHHVPAATWKRFRSAFEGKPVVQFTATPFRRDGQHVDGRIAFEYSLARAQKDEYFSKIRLRPVEAFDETEADDAIAAAALSQLDADRAAGLNHLLMARTNFIDRAKELIKIYRRLAPQWHPVLAHSRQPRKEREQAIADLKSGRSCVLVCVEMLGEGFDLPELKIAALHDVHKSLAVTLQFAGRFTRTKPGLGPATVVANVADPQVESSLERLYAEDADWNSVLSELSAGATSTVIQDSEFLAEFDDAPPDLPLHLITPAMSTVVYRTRCAEWTPLRAADAFPEGAVASPPTLNRRQKVLVLVVRNREPVRWAGTHQLRDATWTLYLGHWDQPKQLLYIYISDTDGHAKELAQAIGGADAALVSGQDVYRTLHGINQLILMNLGVSHSLQRAVRFTMYVGSDIREGLAEATLHDKQATNLFGRGYRDGEPTSLGCSYRGRIWAYRTASGIREWIDWCRDIGSRVNDASISIPDLFGGMLVGERLVARPAKVPVCIEWPDRLWNFNEEAVSIASGDEASSLLEVELDLASRAPTGPLRFTVAIEGASTEYEVRLQADGATYHVVRGKEAYLVTRRGRTALSQWLERDPPTIRFADGSFLAYGNELFQPRGDAVPPWDAGRIETIDWHGVDLRKESQRTERRSDSIQYRMLRHIEHEYGDRYVVVFDDDGRNEAGDIVCLGADGTSLLVDLFHCKWSKAVDPKALLDDLYEVCGQAQRSVKWKGHLPKLFQHLKKREDRRSRAKSPTRFERGNLRALRELERRSRALRAAGAVTIVQPGLSRAAATPEALRLLAATEVYVRETYGCTFRVIGSV